MGKLTDYIKEFPKRKFDEGRDFLDDNLDEIVYFVTNPKKASGERIDLFKKNLTDEKDLFKYNFGVFISDSINRKYIINETLSICAGYGAAIATSMYFDGTQISDEANLGVNLLVKGSAYIGTNIALMGTMNFKDYWDKKRNFKEDVSSLLDANKDSFVISYTLKSVFYLSLLKSDLVSSALLPLVAYPLAGIIGLGFKQKKTHKFGLYSLKAFENKNLPENLEEKLLEEKNKNSC